MNRIVVSDRARALFQAYRTRVHHFCNLPPDIAAADIPRTAGAIRVLAALTDARIRARDSDIDDHLDDIMRFIAAADAVDRDLSRELERGLR